MTTFFKDLYHTWIPKRPSVSAVSPAYYGIFRFVPIIYIELTVTGIFFDEITAADQFSTRLAGTVVGLIGAVLALGIEAVRYLYLKVLGMTRSHRRMKRRRQARPLEEPEERPRSDSRSVACVIDRLEPVILIWNDRNQSAFMQSRS